MFKDYKLDPMKLEGLTNYNDSTLLSCFVDDEQIEDGFRFIKIPEYTEIIGTGAFEEYNSCDISLNIFHILSDSNYYINEWKKKYKIFSYEMVMLFITLTILICGGIIDWFLFYKL